MADTQSFDEIDVQRINIREPDGTLRMTLSGNAKTPDPLLEGTPHDRTGSRGAGMLFFDDEGFECGGHVFGGRDASGYQSLTFDRVKTDQVVQLSYGEEAGRWGAVLNFIERSATPLTEIIDVVGDREAMTERLGPANVRLSLGFGSEEGPVIGLMDSKGRPRIVLKVGDDDEPRMQFLDADGNITFSLPPGA